VLERDGRARPAMRRPLPHARRLPRRRTPRGSPDVAGGGSLSGGRGVHRAAHGPPHRRARRAGPLYRAVRRGSRPAAAPGRATAMTSVRRCYRPLSVAPMAVLAVLAAPAARGGAPPPVPLGGVLAVFAPD